MKGFYTEECLWFTVITSLLHYYKYQPILNYDYSGKKGNISVRQLHERKVPRLTSSTMTNIFRREPLVSLLTSDSRSLSNTGKKKTL